MKSGQSHLLGTTRMSHYTGRLLFDDRKGRAVTDVVLSAGWVAIMALSIVMAVALYRWGHHAPVFGPDGGPGVPIAESMIWS